MDALVQRWIERDPDPQTRAEAAAITDPEQIKKRFGKRLAFGTAGLRGLLGCGWARMNRLVVRETTAGLGAYLLKGIPDAADRGVVVGYDGRRGSLEFAQDTAGVLVAMGFRVYLTDTVAPTPLCAFATLEKGAAAGVVVTASHNPPDYNGYKVYWDNGAQIITPHDEGIAAAIEEAAKKELPYVDATGSDRVVMLSEPTKASYLAAIAKHQLHKPAGNRGEFGIAYTPLHGVGAELCERALSDAGFTKTKTVTSQREPDGAFPTVNFPNPEEPGAMDAVVALAREMGAELAVANDPDADRLAVAALNAAGEYQMLTGNQIGVLLGADQLDGHDSSAAVGVSIVSSRMLGAIARARGAHYFETLTGFKWIANVALTLGPEHQFVFGYEEALGYTVSTTVRDKDGISAMIAFAEMAAALAANGKTVWDRLTDLYREHGLYLTKQHVLKLDPDAPGPSLGERLRNNPPSKVAGRALETTLDLGTGVQHNADGTSTPAQLPRSDVLIYTLDDDTRVIVRPSGTEPKLKCYYEILEPLGDGTVEAAQTRGEARMDTLIEVHQRELTEL